MIRSIVNIRRAVNILAAREDVDARRIAFVGHSFGAMMGAVAAADKRFNAAVSEGDRAAGCFALYPRMDLGVPEKDSLDFYNATRISRPSAIACGSLLHNLACSRSSLCLSEKSGWQISHHSNRSAFMGSTRVALRAGGSAAAADTNSSTSATPPMVAGSRALT